MKENIFNGNINTVEYKNNCIYRDVTKYSDTIHRFLKHLETKNIDFVPKFIKIENNKAVYSFVEGNTIEDYPHITNLEDKIKIIEQIAKMLKIFHDASLDFKIEKDDQWFLEYRGNLFKEVICHNDIASYNVTFKNNLPVGLIDFDTICLAPRVYDIAYALYRFVPLSNEIYDPILKSYRQYDKTIDSKQRKVLVEHFLKVYPIDPSINIYEILIERLEDLVLLFDRECAKGNIAFIKMKEEGHQLFYKKEIEFIKANYKDW